MSALDDAPAELAQLVVEFWPQEQWDNAVEISRLESGWSPFAENNTVDAQHPCGSHLAFLNGVEVTAERSIGWYQINACNLPPDWRPEHLFNSRHNVGTAHDMWTNRGWRPWFFSAQKLGLLP
jgi:hypothetical protein